MRRQVTSNQVGGWRNGTTFVQLLCRFLSVGLRETLWICYHRRIEYHCLILFGRATMFFSGPMFFCFVPSAEVHLLLLRRLCDRSIVQGVF